ncbi:MAG: F0F1 ATP synthase subunit A [Magnetococcales bacterium]|nr:F0F1 ATP synthase subunit A [Magnetococcales bacterium]MBF0346783.1 F0F1 ATP synthase subunit A [Magnetococcales bacterium]MBF0630970.1 F0F1 ATP synthase subunit A [Magnetococcales bacterium]
MSSTVTSTDVTNHAIAAVAPKMDPLHHFLVTKQVDVSFLGLLDISISNSVLWMWIAIALVMIFFRLAFKNPTTVPGRMQSLGELGYLFIHGIVTEIIGDKGRPFFPYIFTLFYFILFCNLAGLIPGSFTVTSQLIVTATFSMSIVAFSFVYGFYLHGSHYLKFFVPSGVPVLLMPLMVPIEIISFLARPVSLAVRLFANMTAGHTMLAVMFFYVITLPWWGAWLPFGFTVVFTGVEIFIGFIQAYIFTILTCVYINDSIHMH